MTFDELSQNLRDTVRRAPHGEIVVSIHVFGIKYEEALREVTLKDLVEAAGIHSSYHTEIREGMNLSKYLTLR
jgi:hypothetical protein